MNKEECDKMYKDYASFENKPIEEMRKELDYKILSLFNLEEDPFVKYANEIQIPILTRTLSNCLVSEEEMIKYSNVFFSYWNELFKDKYSVKINIYLNNQTTYCIFEMKVTEKKCKTSIEFIKKMDIIHKYLNKFLINKIDDFYYENNQILNFEKDSFFILKTNNKKNWHEANAKMDLAEVISTILDGERETL